VLKIEETVDYLLLERGEFVIMSSAVENAAIENEQIAEGRLVVILPEGHALARKESVSAADLSGEALIGVDPADPYGALLARPFAIAGVDMRHAMRGRFAQTVVSLVRHGLGVAVIDEFSVAEVYMPGLERRPLTEDVKVNSFVARKRGRVLSGFAEYAIAQFRRELGKAVEDGPWYRSRK
jgi:DNA-binding transcriptional LysR family regulator